MGSNFKSGKPLSGAQITLAVLSTFVACQVLFWSVQFGMRRWCRCRFPCERASTNASSPPRWHDGFPWILGATHTVVFVVAVLQHGARATLVSRGKHSDDQEDDDDYNSYVWDVRIILLYYESCILSFFLILAAASIHLWYFPERSRRQDERCDDTAEASSVEDSVA